MSWLSFFRNKKPPAAQQPEHNYEAEGLTPERRDAVMESIRRYRAPNPAWDAVNPEVAAAAHQEFLDSHRITK